MPSLHLEAELDQIAETVLLPGDPLRAKNIAETLLEGATCYNRVRNMLGFTGFYQGKKVSVQGAGMGMGSTGIYVNELINTYRVKKIIRVGTCGALQDGLLVGDVILAMSASGDSSANNAYFENIQYAATADFDLLLKAHQVARRLKIKTRQGNVFSTDNFYQEDTNRWDKLELHGVLGVEMESQIVYTLANKYNIKALSILTVSDHIKSGLSSGQEQREKSFLDMARIALELV